MTMIRRVAAKLHELTLQNTGTSRAPEDMMDDARAIIEAMREPSAAMKDVLFEMNDRNSDTQIAGVYTRMIDAALAEEGP